MVGRSKLALLGATLFSVLSSEPATAQSQSQAESAGEQTAPIAADILLADEEDVPFVLDLTLREEANAQKCAADLDASQISGEIIVCARKRDNEAFRLNPDIGPSYAEATMLKGAPRAPDFILDCAEQGWPFGCIKLSAEQEPPLLIDVTALPEAPPGSDADGFRNAPVPENKSPANSEGSAEPEG